MEGRDWTWGGRVRGATPTEVSLFSNVGMLYLAAAAVIFWFQSTRVLFPFTTSSPELSRHPRALSARLGDDWVARTAAVVHTPKFRHTPIAPPPT